MKEGDRIAQLVLERVGFLNKMNIKEKKESSVLISVLVA